MRKVPANAKCDKVFGRMAAMTRREFFASSVGAAAALGLATEPSGAAQAPSRHPGSTARPSVVLMLADDMGFSDIGCYGSEIRTPYLDGLAARGLRFRQFYNSPRCCPSRAALLTGLYSHQAGFGLMADDYGRFSSPAYSGDLGTGCVTIAEVLKQAGYQTAMAGKWHLTPPLPDFKHNWPLQRGFDHYFGTITGAGSFFDPATLTRDNQPIRAKENFYYTDAIGDNAAQFIDQFRQREDPFFLYVAFTAPHWPLQAPEEDTVAMRTAIRSAGMLFAGSGTSEWSIWVWSTASGASHLGIPECRVGSLPLIKTGRRGAWPFTRPK